MEEISWCVHCPTQEIADEVARIYNNVTQAKKWNINKENTVLYLKENLYGMLQNAISSKYTVLTAEEFFAKYNFNYLIFN
jgi:hypothetical protein